MVEKVGKGNILCMKETLVIRIWLNSDSQIALIYEGGEKRYTDGLAFKVVSIKSIQ